jgi:phospholipid/cholesterol/gamma-HCH transport system substrate-binding protein
VRVNKQAPSVARILVMVLFALSCFGLLLFLWLSFGGSTPLKPKGYRVQVAFPQATQLAVEADVRVAGVSVGKVRKKRLDPAKPNRTVAVLELDRRYAPIAQDARATLRQKTLLGETYVELTPGDPDGPKVAEDGWLADARVREAVELDEVLEALDPRTRQAFRTWQQSLAQAVDGRGQDLNDALGELPAFVGDGRDLLDVLDGQDEEVRALLRNTGVTFAALTEDEGALRELVETSDVAFGETARRQRRIAELFAVLPTFLRESKVTSERLERFAGDTDPLVRELRPALRALPPALRDVKAFAPDLRDALRDLDPLITASKTGLPALREVLDGTTRLLGEVQPFLEELVPVLEWLEYSQRGVADFLGNGTVGVADRTATSTPQEVGHYLRQFGPTGAETIAIYPERPAASRGNAYLLPGALSGRKRAQLMIFPNFDCDNAAPASIDKAPAVDSGGAPACFVQTPPVWPQGNTRPYPRIERNDYTKRASVARP